jgi:putative membrane protein
MTAPLALLHTTASIGWTRWTIHWSTVAGLVALGAMYLWAARRAGARASAGSATDGTPRPSRRQHILFFTGLAAIFASLNGPLHDLSDSYLFSAHMVQHLVLTLIVPPLLLAGVTGDMLRPALRLPVVGWLARRLTRPMACFAIVTVTLAAWHLPPVYNLALTQHWVHILQHLMFMAAAVLMWWPILSPLPELPRLSYPAQMLYCFLLSIPMSIISVYIVYADGILYPAYASAARVWKISPMSDQLIGGLIMWIPGGLFLFGVATVVFFKWAGREEQDLVAEQLAH